MVCNFNDYRGHRSDTLVRLFAVILIAFLFLIAPFAIAQDNPANASLNNPVGVALPVGHPFPVTLDSPLSTRDSKQGQIVTFHLTYSLLLGDGLEVPPNTKLLGRVVEVKRPGHFDKESLLQLSVDRMQLNAPDETPDSGTNLNAHLNSPLGSTEITGIVSGVGTSAPVLTLTSHEGQELYLISGTRFTVTLDRPAHLNGDAIRTAQQNFKQDPGPYGIEASSEKDSTPKLKHRRAPQQ